MRDGDLPAEFNRGDGRLNIVGMSQQVRVDGDRILWIRAGEADTTATLRPGHARTHREGTLGDVEIGSGPLVRERCLDKAHVNVGGVEGRIALPEERRLGTVVA